MGAPPAGPVIFDSNFWSHHFIEKVVFFLNARRFYYAKITFLSDEMTRAGSGIFFKRKFMVLGPVLAYFVVKAPIAPPTLCAAGQPDRWRRYKRHPAGEP